MMVTMKYLFLLILLVSVTLFPHAAGDLAYAEEPAAPEEVYAVADSREVWFYASENPESGLFILPYTYYVKVLRKGTLFCAVKYLEDVAPYKSVTGFCKTEDLTFVDFIPERPFLKREITVNYSAENATGTWMGRGTFDKLQRSFIYFGESYLGTARFYYVYADGAFDYVPATGEIVYELNTDYLKPVSGEGDAGSEEPEEPSTGLSGGQIAMILLAAGALFAIALFVLRGKKSPSPMQDDF